MTAIVRDEYGTAPEKVLRLAEVPRPTIADDEILVRVRAASVDRGTWHLMAGLPYPIRLAGFGFRRPKAPNPGHSLAGTVESAGQNVTGFKPGDEVYGTCDGSFAPYARARAGRLAPKPANLSFGQAAAVPVSALTALQAVRDQAQVQAGQKVLIIGASGGVGTFAVQIARAFGAEVTGVCSTAKTDLVRAIGADHVIDYTREDFADGQHRYDIILDIGGTSGLSHLRRALTHRGRLVLVGGESGGRWLGGMDRLLRARLLFPLVSQKLSTFIASENSADLRILQDLIESGKIAPAIDRTYPLSQTPARHPARPGRPRPRQGRHHHLTGLPAAPGQDSPRQFGGDHGSCRACRLQGQAHQMAWLRRPLCGHCRTEDRDQDQSRHTTEGARTWNRSAAARWPPDSAGQAMGLHRSARTSPAHPAPTPWAKSASLRARGRSGPSSTAGSKATSTRHHMSFTRFSVLIQTVTVASRTSMSACLPRRLTSQMTDSTLLRKPH